MSTFGIGKFGLGAAGATAVVALVAGCAQQFVLREAGGGRRIQ